MSVYYSLYFAALIGFAITLFISVALVLTTRLHGAFSFDQDEGVQKFHLTPTPRIGGVALALGFFATWFFMYGEAKVLFGLIGLSALPALVFGLAEDITHRVSVRIRLAATILSGMLFISLTGYTVTNSDLPLVDWLLAAPVIAFVFTAFVIGGVANAINLIDGFHGLASGTLVIVLVAFAFVGWRVGDGTFVMLSVAMLAIVFGFFVVNFPFGKLFLGDAGAYFAGFFVAALAVMLPARNPEVSAWVSLLILGYPVTEMLASILRRFFDVNAHPGKADSSHLHHLVYRSVAQTTAGLVKSPTSQNPLTSLFMWVLPLSTFVFAAYCNLQSTEAMLYIGVLVLLYFLSYRGFAWSESHIRGSQS